MLRKHGTGTITNPDDTGQQPVTRTAASRFSEQEWEALMAEGEPESDERE